MQILYYCLANAKQIVVTRVHEVLREHEEHLWEHQEHRVQEEQRSGGYCLAVLFTNSSCSRIREHR